MATDNNFRVKNGLDVAGTATVAILKFTDGTSATSISELIGATDPTGPTGTNGLF